MTQKRYKKLVRAYFTRLNEWAKETGRTPMNMGRVYKGIENMKPTSRTEWWSILQKSNTFNVGVKER